MTKKEQRHLLKTKIQLFENKGQASLEIAKKLINLPEYQNSKSVFVYLSLDHEVNTDIIIKNAFKERKKVYVPIIEKNGKMYPSRVYPFSFYKKGSFGIREPVIKRIAKYSPDIAVIPLLGFDKEKNRLGRGGGYYDRFLKDFRGAVIALAFSCQRLDNIENESHDIRPQIIITEDKVF